MQLNFGLEVRFRTVLILHHTHVVDARKGIQSKKNVAPKLFMMAQLKRGHCTARSTVLAAPAAMVKDKSGERSQTISN